MQITITAAPIFHLPLGLAELNLLSKMASTHYDAVCRATSKAGPGGFIYGWIGRTQALVAEPDHIPGSERLAAGPKELDILLKVLENTGGLSDDDRDAARRLTRNLSEAVRFAGQVVPAWKEVFGGV